MHFLLIYIIILYLFVTDSLSFKLQLFGKVYPFLNCCIYVYPGLLFH